MKNTRTRKVAALLASTAVVATGAVALPATGNADGPVAGTSAKKAKAKLYDDYFDPSSMKIKKGTRFTWKDLGSNPHNVTLEKGPKGVKKKDFKSGTLGYLDTFKRKFKKKGTYEFVCTLHFTQMQQTIKVKG